LASYPIQLVAPLLRAPTYTIIGNVAYIGLGLLVIAFSKPLGRAVARGLES